MITQKLFCPYTKWKLLTVILTYQQWVIWISHLFITEAFIEHFIYVLRNPLQEN